MNKDTQQISFEKDEGLIFVNVLTHKQINFTCDIKTAKLVTLQAYFNFIKPSTTDQFFTQDQIIAVLEKLMLSYSIIYCKNPYDTLSMMSTCTIPRRNIIYPVSTKYNCDIASNILFHVVFEKISSQYAKGSILSRIYILGCVSMFNKNELIFQKSSELLIKVDNFNIDIFDEIRIHDLLCQKNNKELIENNQTNNCDIKNINFIIDIINKKKFEYDNEKSQFVVFESKKYFNKEISALLLLASIHFYEAILSFIHFKIPVEYFTKFNLSKEIKFDDSIMMICQFYSTHVSITLQKIVINFIAQSLSPLVKNYKLFVDLSSIVMIYQLHTIFINNGLDFLIQYCNENKIEVNNQNELSYIHAITLNHMISLNFSRAKYIRTHFSNLHNNKTEIIKTLYTQCKEWSCSLIK